MLFGLKEILNLYNVKALKNLSQNFIFDQNLLRKIVSVGSPPSAETAVIEIGPAAGNLTRALLGRGYDKILLIEKDLRFKPILEQLENYADGKIQVKFGDALKFDESWFPSSWSKDRKHPFKLQIIGNLPFAVATPLTLNLIKEFSLTQRGLFKNFSHVEMVFLFQNEVAQKFCAKVGTRNYGRLAIMAQTFCDVSYAFPIERIKFTPRPKVDSGLVKFQIKSAQHIASFASSTDFFDNMEELTGKVFRHKNKKLDAVPIPWAELGIDSNLRPHHLSPENIVAAVQKLYK